MTCRESDEWAYPIQTFYVTIEGTHEPVTYWIEPDHVCAGWFISLVTHIGDDGSYAMETWTWIERISNESVFEAGERWQREDEQIQAQRKKWILDMKALAEHDRT